MASIFYWLDRYVDVLQQVISGKVVLAPLLLLFVEEAGVPIPIPGDAIIAYTGYRLSVTHGLAGFWEAFMTAQVAVLVGSTVLFFLSRRWGQLILSKLGAFIFLQEKHLHRAERLFAKYGIFTIIIGRHVPGLRMPITFFAATSGVKYPTFIVSTFISTSLWIIFYLTIGKSLGVTFHQQLQQYIGLAFAATAAFVLIVFGLHLIGAYRNAHTHKKEDGSTH